MSPWRWWGVLSVLAVVLGWWSAQTLSGTDFQAQPSVASAPTIGASGAGNPTLSAFQTTAGPWDARQAAKPEVLALWRSRLERAEMTLASYREATRYPFSARPLTEQPDQAYPYQPIKEERAFRLPQGQAMPGLTLKTTQDRVHIQAQESVTVTVAAVNDKGEPLPLSIQRAWAHEGGRGQLASYPHFANVAFRDDGLEADQLAGDGIHTAIIAPARMGFAELAGTLRVEVSMQAQWGESEQPGYAYFDVVTHPEQAAEWLAGARDRMDKGSLVFELPLLVHKAGRYVVTGRVDDANGKPFALLTFNEELSGGKHQVRMTLFGKMVRDLKPKFPLKLRDVQAFRLIPDSFPDRVLLPAEQAPVVASSHYPFLSFSDTEWQSEERSRYLAEYSKDVLEAQEQLRHLQGGSP